MMPYAYYFTQIPLLLCKAIVLKWRFLAMKITKDDFDAEIAIFSRFL